jgi:hypothetical protein
VGHAGWKRISTIPQGQREQQLFTEDWMFDDVISGAVFGLTVRNIGGRSGAVSAFPARAMLRWRPWWRNTR